MDYENATPPKGSTLLRFIAGVPDFSMGYDILDGYENFDFGSDDNDDEDQRQSVRGKRSPPPVSYQHFIDLRLSSSLSSRTSSRRSSISEASEYQDISSDDDQRPSHGGKLALPARIATAVPFKIPSVPQRLASRIRKSRSISPNSSPSIKTPAASKRPQRSKILAMPVSSTFPPGQDVVGFVPLGTPGLAIAAQGNIRDIDHLEKRSIVKAERDAMMKYPEIHAKYPAWGIGQDALRGLDRNARRPVEKRPRVVVWTDETISELHRAVALNTTYRGNKSRIHWPEVIDEIELRTEKRYGKPAAKAKWEATSV